MRIHGIRFEARTFISICALSAGLNNYCIEGGIDQPVKPPSEWDVNHARCSSGVAREI